MVLKKSEIIVVLSLLWGLGLLLAVSPAMALPPADEVLEELDAFRAKKGAVASQWRSDEGDLTVSEGSAGWQAEGLSDLLGGSAEDEVILGRLLSGLELSSWKKLLEPELRLRFGEGERQVVYWIGRVDEAGSVELVVDRDSYALVAARWIDSRGSSFELKVLQWQDKGWSWAEVELSYLGKTLRFERQ